MELPVLAIFLSNVRDFLGKAQGFLCKGCAHAADISRVRLQVYLCTGVCWHVLLSMLFIKCLLVYLHMLLRPAVM